MKTELKPCQCGGKAVFTDPDWEEGYTAHVAVICTKCGMSGTVIDFSIRDNCGGIGSVYRKPYEDKAANAWNTRPIEDALQARITELEKQVENYRNRFGAAKAMPAAPKEEK